MSPKNVPFGGGSWYRSPARMIFKPPNAEGSSFTCMSTVLCNTQIAYQFAAQNSTMHGKNTGIYAVSCMLSEAFFGCQRHKNIVNYTIFTRGQYQKIMKNWPTIDQKTPNKDLQNASSNFTLFFPTPNPQKRENPSRLKDFRGGSAAGARPRVAKAMLSCHHYTARHRRIIIYIKLRLLKGSANLTYFQPASSRHQTRPLFPK